MIDVAVAAGLFLIAAVAGAWLIETRLRQHREANRSWEVVEHNRIVAAIEVKLEETIAKFLPAALYEIRQEVKALADQQDYQGGRIREIEAKLGMARDPRSLEERIGLPRIEP